MHLPFLESVVEPGKLVVEELKLVLSEDRRTAGIEVFGGDDSFSELANGRPSLQVPLESQHCFGAAWLYWRDSHHD